VDRDIAAGQVAGGGIARAGLDVESIQRAGAVIGDIDAETDLLVFADFIDAGEMGLAAGRESQIGDLAGLNKEAGGGITEGEAAGGFGFLFRLGEGDMEIERSLIAGA